MEKSTLTIALVLLLLCSCNDDPVSSDVGCRTAVDKSTDERVFLRCETRDKFNPTNIRASQWDTTDSLYYDYAWEACDQCK